LPVAESLIKLRLISLSVNPCLFFLFLCKLSFCEIGRKEMGALEEDSLFEKSWFFLDATMKSLL
jgi:hypothetical protein